MMTRITHYFTPMVSVTAQDGRVGWASVDWFGCLSSAFDEETERELSWDEMVATQGAACGFLDNKEMQAELRAVLAKYLARQEEDEG